MKKTDKGMHHVVFQPTFGNRPDQYIGREGILARAHQLNADNH